MDILIDLVRTSQSHRIVRMCLASLTQIVGGAAATSDSCDYESIFTGTAQLAADCLSGSPRADDWLVLSSQSGLFCVRITVCCNVRRAMAWVRSLIAAH